LALMAAEMSDQKMKCDPEVLMSINPTEASEELTNRIESFFQEELFEIQALGFSCSMALEGVLDSFSEAVRAVMEDAKKKLSKKYKPEDVAKAIDKLTSCYTNAYLDESSEMRKVIKAHLGFPPDYLPPSYAHNVISYTAEFEEELDQKIANAENRFKANCKMAKELNKEMKKAEELDDIPKEANELSRRLSQMQEEYEKMSKTLKELKPILEEKALQLKSLNEEVEDNESESDSWDDDF